MTNEDTAAVTAAMARLDAPVAPPVVRRPAPVLGPNPLVAPVIVAPVGPEPRATVPTIGTVVSHQGTAETVQFAPEGAVGPVAPGVSRAHVPVTPWRASPGYPKSTPDGVVVDWGPNGPPVPAPVVEPVPALKPAGTPKPFQTPTWPVKP
jgi:hypothetical protein